MPIFLIIITCPTRIKVLVLTKQKIFFWGIRVMALTTVLCICGIVFGYTATWLLVLKSRKIIKTIDKEKLHDAREIVQRLKL